MTGEDDTKHSRLSAGQATWRVPAAEFPHDIASMLAGRQAAQLNLYRALDRWASHWKLGSTYLAMSSTFSSYRSKSSLRSKTN